MKIAGQLETKNFFTYQKKAGRLCSRSKSKASYDYGGDISIQV